MQISAPRKRSDFPGIGGGGRGSRGDSGGQGAYRLPESKWNFCTHETSLVTLWVHFWEGKALPKKVHAQISVST